MAIIRYICSILVLIAGMVFAYLKLSDAAKNDVKLQEFLSKELKILWCLICASALIYSVVGE